MFKKEIDILSSTDWPNAVFDFQIVDSSSEEDKFDRAEGIIDIIIEEDIKEKNFLDFGCGEGHVAKYVSTKANYSVGYDIERSFNSKLNWELEESKFLLTTNFKKVEEKSPYDIILIYDVLDHASNPSEILSLAKSLLDEEGRIYLRCHPWSSRHGGHYYNQINKAFVHLVFTEEELILINKELKIQKKTSLTIEDYPRLIEEADLSILKKEIEKQDIENFFIENNIIKKRILNNYNKKAFQEMPICFLDFILKKPQLDKNSISRLYF